MLQRSTIIGFVIKTNMPFLDTHCRAAQLYALKNEVVKPIP